MSWFVTMCFLMACHYSHGQSSETAGSLRSAAIVRQPSNQRAANERGNALLDYANPTEKENAMPWALVKPSAALSSDADIKAGSRLEESINDKFSINDRQRRSRTRRSEQFYRESENGHENLPKGTQERLGRLGNFYPRHEPHQQSTNMRPRRSYFLELYDKNYFADARLREGQNNYQDSIRSYSARYAAPRDGIPRNPKNPLQPNSHPRKLRSSNESKRSVENYEIYENDPSRASSASPENNVFRTGPEISNFDRTGSTRPFGLNPTRVNALQGVFDNGKIFQESHVKQYSVAEPRIIIQNSKISPANYEDANSEARTVQELVNLIGQSPQQQLQGLNILLGTNRQILSTERPRDVIPVSEIPTSYEPTFVTPLPEENPKSPPEIYRGRILINSNLKNHQSERRPVDLANVQKGVVNFENHQTVPTVWTESELPESEVDFEKSKKNNKDNRSSEKDYTQYASKYSFGYHVTDPETGSDFGHHEKREGDVTTGRYHVLLPDGRIQSVSYHVDDKGYHAQVSYRPHQGH